MARGRGRLGVELSKVRLWLTGYCEGGRRGLEAEEEEEG